jgi:hypothetical protein
VTRSRRSIALAVSLCLATLASPLAGRAAPPLRFRTLAAAAPAWYTPELHAQVLAAGDRGVTMPDAVNIPAAGVAFLGIRPGQQIIIGTLNSFTLCTSNFVFRNGSNYAIGTAGHCGNVGQPVTMILAPRLALNIGKVIMSTGDAGVGNDFALISIKRSLNSIVSPSMAAWGGPTRAYTSSSAPLAVKHIGWGLGIGAGGTPRIGIGTVMTSTVWGMIGVTNKGDSGGPANTGDNRALGNITHIACCQYGTHTAVGTTIARILQIAGGWTLATCKKATPWPLYGCP